MIEDSSTNSSNRGVNSKGLTPLQLLHRRSSDEDYNDDEEEEEEEEVLIEDEPEMFEEDENDDDEDVEEIEKTNVSSALVSQHSVDQLHHSISSPKLTSPSICPFRSSWGRGARSTSTPPSPALSTIVCDRQTIHDEYKAGQNVSTTTTTTNEIVKTSRTTTTIRGTNAHFQSFPSKRFDETINFSFNVSSTKIIFVNNAGYRQAIQFLESCDIIYEPTRNYPDIWSFCLNSRTIRFYRSSEYKSDKLNQSKESKPPQICIFPSELSTSNKPFWFLFEQRPIFNEMMFNNDLELSEPDPLPITNNTVLGRIKFYRNAHVNLSYGALTSMNEYYFHPEYTFSKQNEWTILFRSKKLEIDRLISSKKEDEKHYTNVYAKSVLPADLIDRTAIITVNQLGFTVYICIKGNVHEFIRTTYPGNRHSQNERISSLNNDCPIFSTLCLHTFVKTHGSNANNDATKYAALGQIKALFKYFLDFFYDNQISVCFAPIETHRGCLTNLSHLTKHFTNSIQRYAFSMLRNVGYCIELKLSKGTTISDLLLNLAGNDDDKFYRLCLYLFRRSTEFHFLNLEHELRQANREYEMQVEQCKTLNETMATILSPPRPNYAYVPSIRVTPTTIQVQPLKLVKLHRVIRDMNFDDPMSYALIDIRDEANRALYARDFRSLRKKFEKILTNGIRINKSTYQYLHHSMSQVKEKQFWFLDNRHSLENVLTWMGNFDNEHVIAKHAARMAQCFTSTEPSIRIPAELVTYVLDVETSNKQYCFTDGVGTISQTLCKEVQRALGRRFMPSVLQIRYGGCKGTLSVDPNLDEKCRQLVIRESMRKFTTDHDKLEICKVSSPRALHLNRQNILLLSSRNISEAYFLVLQNENHLWLVQALLCSSIAFELLNERVGSMYFNFRDLANAINLVEEPFFLQLIITCGHDSVSKFQQRAKIKVAKDKARNMFGIVDEYGVLEYGEVFIQYSQMNDEKLDSNEKPPAIAPTILDNVKVVITKNPCYHPGDLRKFTAVDKIELRHLVDVVVFPQKGPRPHPNEISGSDLDGDEYAVIWDPNLVPTTDNDEPYDYDSQEKPIKVNRTIERKDIIEVVLDIAAQNLTGDMSNAHLALADYLGPRHPKVLHLAGLISQELDAPKTGKHPISNEELNQYRNDSLEGRYPDFMMREHYKSYLSDKTIGQLYRSARRAIIRWHKAARTHCSLRHLHTAQLDDETHLDSIVQTPNGHIYNGFAFNNEVHYEPSLSLNPSIHHPLSRSQEDWANKLFLEYQEGLKTIISVFNYQDEIDLFCRCEALDQLASGKQDLNISAGLELQRLIETTRRHFYHSFDQLSSNLISQPPHSGSCTRDRSCEKCKDLKLARAAACYYVCYTTAARQSTKARSRILSFPWLFSSLLIELKKENQKSNPTPSKYIVIGRAMRNMAKRLLEENELKPKVYVSIYSEEGCLYFRSVKSTNEKTIKRQIKADQQTDSMCLTKILFIEIMNNWIRKQNIFSELASTSREKKPLIREICWHQLLRCFILNKDHPDISLHFEDYKIIFQSSNHPEMTQRYTEFIQRQISIISSKFDNSMYDYSIQLINICFQLARQYQSEEYAYLSDYLILALQSIGIEKDFNDIIFDLDT
ncbi:hypothetical protein I4U23_006870 [Adineta vaga]|nr:hypothetical protein I4U23_006870 [Adineta vaga]